MKDFHDILLLCRNNNLLNIDLLKVNINNTFKNRNANVSIPIKFSKDEYARLQLLWSAHLRALSNSAKEVLGLPESIIEVMDEINGWLKKVGVSADPGSQSSTLTKS